MKIIILSAFNGRLRSEPLEWPDEPPSIIMPLARSAMGYWNMGMEIPAQPPTPPQSMKNGIFEHTRKYQILDSGRTAAIYELVDL